MKKGFTIFSTIWMFKEFIAVLVILIGTLVEISGGGDAAGWILVYLMMFAVVLGPMIVLYLVNAISYLITLIKGKLKIAFVLFMIYVVFNILEYGIVPVYLIIDGATYVDFQIWFLIMLFLIVLLVNVVLAVLLGRKAFKKEEPAVIKES